MAFTATARVVTEKYMPIPTKFMAAVHQLGSSISKLVIAVVIKEFIILGEETLVVFQIWSRQTNLQQFS
jgi:hypothetical protein